MTVSIKAISAGDGYRYLMRSVAAGDGDRAMSTALTRYYTESGNPPGRWLGSGLSGIDEGRGLAAGSVASEEQMFRLFGMGNDPVAGEQLGSRPYRIATDGRGSVAGFDLTFSAPKSVSAWWALADADTQQEILDAHHAAMNACIGLLERDVAATRIGHNGIAQAQVRGLISVAFDHWESRAGDPQLHTHLVVANRVQTSDGAWRTLDSRALYRSVVAVSETYNGLLADELTARLGVSWQQRTRRHSTTPAWEIADVSPELIIEFSQRSQAIELEKDELIATFRGRHGREPSSTEILKLRQQATLFTRPDKHLHSLAEMTEHWQERASAVLGMDARIWAKGVGLDGIAAEVTTDLTVDQTQQLACSVMQTVEQKRSTWSRWNLHAEASRQLMGIRFANAEDRLAATARVVDMTAADSILLTPPELALSPPELQREDGTSLFAHRHAEKYTSRALLDAEARLLDAARGTTAPTLPPDVAERMLAIPPPRHRYLLGASQDAAVRSITSSGRTLDVLVGPAGTGKTVTLAGLRAAWEAHHGPGSVIGLAPSAAAAEVLAAELGIATENTAKWLTEADHESERMAQIAKYRTIANQVHTRNPQLASALQQRVRDLSAEAKRWQIQTGQLVVIDEASLAGTLTLDRIVSQARTSGAKVLLVGDWAQLSAVDAGGAFALLVHDRHDAPELTAVRRFTHRWERTATERLRIGDPDTIGTYQDHGRLRDGDTDTMLTAAYQGWLDDERAGQRSLLTAGDHETVTALNARARTELVRSGLVEPDGVPLRDGAMAGIGDRIVTRRNDRTLCTDRGFVKNGDTWTVTARDRDGGLTVRRPRGGPQLVLPADYVAEHVDLAYATTAYRAQGSTVQTAHAVVAGPVLTRESFYVAMTRGRQANTAYVITDADGRCEPGPDAVHTAASVLQSVLRNIGADDAAHAVLRAERERAGSIAQLADEYETIAANAQQPRWITALARTALSRQQLDDVHASASFGALSAALRRADAAGLPIGRDLPALVQSRTLADADDVAAVLHDRVTRWAQQRQPTAPGHLVAGLIPAATGINDPDMRAALQTRAELIEQRASALVDRALADDEPWIRRLGALPTDADLHVRWMNAARTVAAYRDRYGDNARPSTEPAPEERLTAQTAFTTAIGLSRREQAAAPDGPEPAVERPVPVALEP